MISGVIIIAMQRTGRLAVADLCVLVDESVNCCILSLGPVWRWVGILARDSRSNMAE